MHTFILLLFFVFTFGQLGRISFLAGTASLYLYEGIVFFILAFLFFKHRLKPIKQSFSSVKSLYIFILVLSISLFFSTSYFSYSQNLIAFLYFLRLCFYLLFFVYLSFETEKNKKTSKSLSKGLLLFAFLTLIFSAIQYFFYPNLRNLYYLGWDEHLYRVFGLFFDTAVASSIYGLLLIYFFTHRDQPVNRKFLSLFFLSFLILAFFTYSRAFYLSFLIVAGIFLQKIGKVHLILVIALALILGVYLLPRPKGEGVRLERTGSIASRLADFQGGAEEFKKSPILGIGYNHIRNVKENRDVNPGIPNHGATSYHSSFLTILVTSGILGLIAFVWFLYELAQYSANAYLYMSFLSVYSLFDNILLHPFILLLLFSLLILDRHQSNLNPSHT